jgi:Uri superfamily endonuclease
MDLPEAKGTYVLIVLVSQMKRLEIGRLGAYDIMPGFYAYVGSAFGPGGLCARLHHHLESAAQPHWHIDYLLAVAEPVEVWYALAGRKLERDLAGLMERSSAFRMPIPRFGSSDYRRRQASHLFYARRRPAFHLFQVEVNQALGEPVEFQQHRINAPTARVHRWDQACQCTVIPATKRPC